MVRWEKTVEQKRFHKELVKKCKPGDILVMKGTFDELLDIMKKCSGIITEVGGENSHLPTVDKSLNESASEIRARAYGCSWCL